MPSNCLGEDAPCPSVWVWVRSIFFGGIEPEALIGAMLILFGVAVVGCALALALSVWALKTYEVLLLTYLLWALVLLAGPLWAAVSRSLPLPFAPSWLANLDPFWLAFAPYARPGAVTLRDQVAFLLGSLALSALLVGLATARVRAVTVRHLGRAERARPEVKWRVSRRLGWSLIRPSLDGNPVLWREWHRKCSSQWVRWVWAVYVILSATCSVLGVHYFVTGSGPGLGIPAVLTNAFQVAIGLLLLSVGAVTALAEERVRGSLDVLLATPLPTWQIVWGKWLGAYRPVPLLVLLPAAVAVAIALTSQPDRWPWVGLLIVLILVYGAAITSLGLALATWVARVGRAVTWSVMAYVVVTAGLLFLLIPLAPPGVGNFWGPPSVSPWMGTVMVTVLCGQQERNEPSLLGWQLFWIFVAASAAVLLYLGTLATFDHCLGRAHSRPWRRS